MLPTPWLAKVRLVAVRLTPGATTPVPPSRIACGLLGALLVIVRVPLRVPLVVGVNVTLRAQEEPAASKLPQLFVSAKSPFTEIEEMERTASPVLESVTDCAPLVVPMA